MAQVDHDVYDYMVDDYDAIDVDDDADEILQARERVCLETDSDEDENEVAVHSPSCFLAIWVGF